MEKDHIHFILRPGVKQVAVVQKEEFVRNPPYHLRDLLLVHKEPEAAKRVQSEAGEKEFLQAKIEQNLAIQSGEPLQFDADDPQTLADVLKRAGKLAEFPFRTRAGGLGSTQQPECQAQSLAGRNRRDFRRSIAHDLDLQR